MAIATLAGWKTHRGYQGTDYDAVVPGIILQAQAFAERFCGRRFDRATYTDEPIDGTGTSVIHTRHWPIQTFTSLKERSGNVSYTLAADSYRVETGEYSRGVISREDFGVAYSSRDGILTGARRVDSFPAGRSRFLATYIAGYGSGVGEIPLPADIELAGFYLIDHFLQDRGYNLGVQSENQGNQGITFLPAEERMRRVHTLLGPFRRCPL